MFPLFAWVRVSLQPGGEPGSALQQTFSTDWILTVKHKPPPLHLSQKDTLFYFINHKIWTLLFLAPQSLVVNPVKSIINTNIRMTEESVNSDLPRHPAPPQSSIAPELHTLLIRKLSLIYISTASQPAVGGQSKLNYADNDYWLS